MSERGRLELWGQIAFIAMCAAVAVAAVHHVAVARTATKPPARAEAIPAGTKLPLPAVATNGGAAPALLLVLSAECRFCTESMPFYRRLAALPEVASGSIVLSVVSVHAVEPMRTYLAEHALASSSVMTVPESGVYVRSTPTIVLTDSEGSVQATWVGALPPSEEKNVVVAVNQLYRSEAQ